MSIRHSSTKIFRKPLKTSQNRGSSGNKSNHTEVSPSSKSGNSSVALANRLVQKRASTDQKIEMLRRKKFDDEMKEVQPKPKILNKSRELARKAEKKIFGEDFFIQVVGEENEAKANKISKTPSKAKSCRTMHEKPSLIPSDRNQNQFFSNFKLKSDAKSQVMSQAKKVISQRTDFKPSVNCNDTLELEEEMGLLEKRLGLDNKTSLGLDDSNENQTSFLFSPNPKRSQRLNFKHKLHIRECK